ncbi:MAG TPA: sulfatase-like hydrolase/transferase [Gaiellaceae bacterium]|nr:sulfatase-like hydrolase/transferase [Gaiellaceae bacterium]
MPNSERPNVVWIFPDEWRHDALGYAGNRAVRTPHLDALAARGTVFSRVYCESPVCQPSRASLLTCSYPREHGVTHNGWVAEPGPETERLERLMPRRPFPAPEVPTYAQRLQAAGYRTSVVGKLHFRSPGREDVAPEEYGFDEVAEEYDKVVLMRDGVETPYTRHLDELGLLDDWRRRQHEHLALLFGDDPEGRGAFADPLPPEHTLDAHLGGRVCEAIGRLAGRDEPFFLQAAFVGPHVPFDGPQSLADLHDPEAIPLAALGSEPRPANLWGEYLDYLYDLLGCEDRTEPELRTIARQYYANLALVDAQAGRVVAALEAAGIADRTWILFSSDHGELIGDHGLMNKAVFYEGSVRVPALVVPPGGGPAARSDELAQGLDVVATILDVAGADRDGLAGRSLLEPGGRDDVVSEIGAFTMAATREWKLVVETATAEPQALWNLRADPDERRDVLAEEGAVAARLVERHVLPYLHGERRP